MQVPYSPVPTADPSSRGTPEFRPQVPSEAFGVNIGQAVEGLGKDISHAGNELYTRAIALKQLENETEAKEADAQYMIKAGELHANYSALQGRAAVEAYPAYQAQLNEERQKLRQNLSTDMARKMYDSSSLSTMSRSIFNGAGHAATQLRKSAVDGATAQYELDTKSVGDDPRNPALFEEKLQRSRMNADAIAAAKDLHPGDPQYDLMVKKFESNLWRSRIEGLARTAPSEARKLLDDNKSQMLEADFMHSDQVVRNTSRTVDAVNIANDVYETNKGTDEKPGMTLKQMEDAARAKAKEVNPNDPILEQHAVQSVAARFFQDKRATQQENWTADNSVHSLIISNKYRNIQELEADPNAAKFIEQMSPQARRSLPAYVANYWKNYNAKDTNDNFIRLKGMAANNLEEFMNADFSTEKLNPTDLRSLEALRSKLKGEPGGDPRVDTAIRQMRGSFASQMEALGIFKRTKDNKEDYDHFTGTLQSALDAWRDTHGKPASYKDITETIGPQVLYQRNEPGMLWGTNKKPFYNQDVPARFTEKFTSDVLAATGKEPTTEQIYKAYVKQQLLQLFTKPTAKGGSSAP